MKKNGIAKSSLLIQKEKELKELQKKKEKIIKNIKVTKSKISDLQVEAEAATNEMINGITRLAELSKLAKELKSLVAELKKKVKLTKKDKTEIEQIVDPAVLNQIEEEADFTFARTPFGTAENFGNRFSEENQQGHNTDEFDRKRKQEMFGAYTVKISENEQKQIRKVYVELAGRFHPDKAENETELTLFNDLMQSINNAYQRGDLDELLEIKARFAEYQTSDAGTAAYDIPVLDVLDEHILRHRNEVNLLDSQLLRLKTELKNLRDSDLGELVKSNKQATKAGDNSSSDFADGTQVMFEMLDALKGILTQWIETGKKPMVFNQFVDGSHPIVQKATEHGIITNIDDDDFDDIPEMSPQEEEELLRMFAMMMERAPKPRQRKR